MRFKNKIILVTGASRGIGRQIAQLYLEEGGEVIICARRESSVALQSGRRKAVFITADVRKLDDIKTIFAHIKKHHGHLDILVNNAGGTPQLPVADAPPSLSESIIRLNLIAPLWMAQQAYPLMKRHKEGGHIINIASLAGLRAAPSTAAYGAAKAGLINLTQSLAMEWGPKIRVNAIAPGMTLQESNAKYYGGKRAMRHLARIVPAGRFAIPEDIANACLFLTSPEAAYLSGCVLEVHGGGERPALMMMQESL